MKLDLPQKWESTTLDSLIAFVIGGDWGKDAEFTDDEYTEVLCIRGSEFRNWDAEKGSTAALRKVKEASLTKRKLKEGDIIVEISGGGPEQPVGRVALIDKTVLSYQPDIPKICTNFFRLVRPVTDVNPEFLSIFLTYFYKSGKIVGYQAGSNNLRNLKFNDYIQIEIPLPPLPEQRRIVAKIEELFTELDAGIASLHTAQAQLKTYRQALLKHAFEGKLTAEWRAANAEKLEPAAVLLQRIAEERQSRYDAAVAEWEAGGKEAGNRGRKPRALRDAPPLSAAELAELPELPDGWAAATLEQLTEFITSGSRGWAKYYSNSGSLFIRAQNLKYDRLDLSDVAYVSIPISSEGTRTKLSIGDLLVTITGANVTKTGYVKSKLEDAYVNQHVALCRLIDPDLVRYLFYYVISDAGGRKVLEEAAYGAGKPGLNLTNLNELKIPVAPLEEQEMIVAEIESRMTVIDQLEQTITTALQQAESLRQSILKKAFAGQLVPQDENDEPASALLARIRAARD